MFKDHPNVVKLAPEVYLYRNFLSEQDLSVLQKAIDALEDSQWLNKDKYGPDSVIPAPNQVFQGSDGLKLLYEKSVEFFGPEYAPLPSKGISKMIEGQALEVHWDSPGHPDDHDHDDTMKDFFAKKEKGVLYDPLDTCHIVQYGYVMYLNDFTGGEIYYTDINLEIAPQKGDLVVHSASSKYKHGVKPVVKGPRYAYTNFITLAQDSPMTLDEYLEEEHVMEMRNEAIAKGINAPAS
jgi:hypothetical protein